MIRVFLAVVAAVLLVPAVQAAGANGPLVEAVSHEPLNPRPGQDVMVTVHLAPEADVSSILVTHCRVEPSYACSVETDSMTQAADGSWKGLVPWQRHFFDGTRWVGYNLLIQTADGNESKAPLEDVPATPAGLPADAGHYYFYEIDAQRADTPGLGPLALVVAFVVGGMLRRRHVA